jgi:peptide deformylase
MDYRIRYWPDKILKKKQKEVDFFDDKLKEYVDIMFKRMEEEDGIGLAANQIGIPYQIIVVDTNKSDRREENEEGVRMAIINPKIVETEGEVQSTEGCLSFPGIQITIPRYKRIKVVAKDIEGNDIEINTDGFLSIVLQHEIDHINGIPFINYLPPVKKKMILEKYKKIKKELERSK